MDIGDVTDDREPDGSSRGDGSSRIEVLMNGRRFTFPAARRRTLIEAARAAGILLPYGCHSGSCGTCLVRLAEGRVEMSRNTWALSGRDRDAGFILACQSRPATDTVFLDYDF